MPSNYIKGRNLEYQAKEHLRTLGYTAFRCAGSRPVDLIAIRNGAILLVECKAGLKPYLSPKQSNHILEISKNVGAFPILVVRKRYRGICWFKISEQGMKEIKMRDLDDYCV